MSSSITRLCKEKGLRLVDGTRAVTIGVTVDDIKKSRQKKSQSCAFARAALREPGVVASYVLRSTAYLEYGDRMERYTLPSSVQKEIVSFDRAGVMAPGLYRFNPPPPANRLDAQRSRSRSDTATQRRRTVTSLGKERRRTPAIRATRI